MEQAKRILEIGVFTSTTTVALAQLPSVERIVACEIEPYLKTWAKPFYEQAGVQDKIDFRVGSALDTLSALEQAGETFDLVFIDADKDGYHKYYEKLMESSTLLAKDGIIIAVGITLQSESVVNVADPARAGQYDIQKFGLRAPRSLQRGRGCIECLQSSGPRGSKGISRATASAGWHQSHQEIVALAILEQDNVAVFFASTDQISKVALLRWPEMLAG